VPLSVARMLGGRLSSRQIRGVHYFTTRSQSGSAADRRLLHDDHWLALTDKFPKKWAQYCRGLQSRLLLATRRSSCNCMKGIINDLTDSTSLLSRIVSVTEVPWSNVDENDRARNLTNPRPPLFQFLIPPQSSDRMSRECACSEHTVSAALEKPDKA